MSNTHNAIELFCEAGFTPSDEFEHMNSRTGEWFAARFHALTWTRSGKVLAAVESEDSILLEILTGNGVTEDELRFAAPDGKVSDSTAQAFLAVVNTWA